jgi:pSer/pThr/pTyr-binding forkhead associated (FHA) protein
MWLRTPHLVSMPKLTFTDPKFAGKTYKLFLEKTTVGRSDANTLVIRDDSVSARHCEILTYGTEVIVRDIGSRNGTFVNGARLHNQQSVVKSGQTVRIGSIEARVVIDASDSLERNTDVTAVFTHARAVRDQRRTRANPPADPGKVLEARDDHIPAEQTILIPKE